MCTSLGLQGREAFDYLEPCLCTTKICSSYKIKIFISYLISLHSCFYRVFMYFSVFQLPGTRSGWTSRGPRKKAKQLIRGLVVSCLRVSIDCNWRTTPPEAVTVVNRGGFADIERNERTNFLEVVRGRHRTRGVEYELRAGWSSVSFACCGRFFRTRGHRFPSGSESLCKSLVGRRIDLHPERRRLRVRRLGDCAYDAEIPPTGVAFHHGFAAAPLRP